MPLANRRKVLVLTHNFPRYPNDISGIGFQPLYRSLSQYLELSFVVPHDGGLQEFEIVNEMPVHRFRYGSDEHEILAYRGEMHKRVLSSPFLARNFLRAYLEKAQFLAKELKPTTIWAHWWIPGGVVARKTSALSSVPFIVTCHGTDIHLLKKMPFLRALARRVFDEAAAITVVSTFLKAGLLQLVGNSFADKVVVAPLIVDESVVGRDPNGKRRPRTIISASRYTKQKNLDILLQSIARLRDEGIDCTLDSFGSGPEEKSLRALSKELKIDDRVHFRQPVPQIELAEWYRQSEIVCLVSEREGFGLMLVEAMMCGCAAIGARSGGITDIISESGDDGILVEPRNPESLANALRNLFTDSRLLSEMAQRGRESVIKRFSAESITNTMLPLFQGG